MTLRAILFDKDGTLVDFAETWGRATARVIDVLAAGDQAVGDRLAGIAHFDLVGSRLLASSPLIAGSMADFGPDWARAVSAPDQSEFVRQLDGLFHEAALLSLAAIDQSAAVLAELKADGYRLGMITNDSEAAARAHCDRLGFAPYLDIVLGYDSGHGRKPSGEPVLAAAIALGLCADEVALVGDTLHDMDAARAAGATAIGVASGYLSEAELAPHADHVVAGISALPALLAGIQARLSSERVREPSTAMP